MGVMIVFLKVTENYKNRDRHMPTLTCRLDSYGAPILYVTKLEEWKDSHTRLLAYNLPVAHL